MVSRVAAAVSSAGFSARCTEAKYAAWAAASKIRASAPQQQPEQLRESLAELMVEGAALLERLPTEDADTIAHALLASDSAVAAAVCRSMHSHQVQRRPILLLQSLCAHAAENSNRQQSADGDEVGR